MKNKIMSNEKGAFLVIFALVLMVLLGFVALGIEGGRWYLVRAELSKSVDAGALAGAINIFTPYAIPLAQDFAKENFQAGYVGTSGSGTPGSARFTASMGNHQVSVTGTVDAMPVLAQLFGVTTIPVSATGVAQKNKVEIMLILDRSGSMGQPIAKMNALKQATVGNCNNPQTAGFICHFQSSQDTDKIGLISFATSARVDFGLNTYFFTPITNSVNAMNPVGATNMDDALDQADGLQGFTNQTGVPVGQRVKQYVVFFSDGMPTALRDTFRYNGTLYDGIVYGVGPSGSANCRPADYSVMSVANVLNRPDSETNTYPGVGPATTGDGKASGGSACPGPGTTKWSLFQTTAVPRSTGGVWPVDQCSIPMRDLLPYFCGRAKQLALDNAQVLKNSGVEIYTIGLGSPPYIDQAFLLSLSSGSGYAYIAPTPTQLQAIFETIAKDIKLRLVQ